MQRFTDFYKEYKEILKESIQSRIDELVNSNVFGSLGSEYIENRFEEYKSRNVVPSRRMSMNKLNTFLDLTEKEYEEILPYVFKMDREVRDKVIDLAKGDTNKTKRINKFYDKKQVKDVFEDSSQINGVLSDWLAVRNKNWNSPKILRGNPSFSDLIDAVALDAEKIKEAEKPKDLDPEKNPDWNMPEGFEFIREVNDLRLYSWKKAGDVCDLDPRIRKDWLATIINLDGDARASWCVGVKDYMEDYGQPDSNGVFKYPMYMVRTKEDGKWVPDVLLHGNSKQIANRKDDPITDEHFDEVYPVLKGYGQQILEGTL